jgi:hypothetical protein
MSGNEQKKSDAAARLAAALDRWVDEGGSQKSLSDRERRAALADEERRVLLCLGAAVIMQWNELPTDVQRALFEHAVSSSEPHRTAALKEQIARFLHKHKDDERDPR